MQKTMIEKLNLKAIQRYMVGNGMFIHTYYDGKELSKEKLVEVVEKAARKQEQVYFIRYNSRKGIVTNSLF